VTVSDCDEQLRATATSEERARSTSEQQEPTSEDLERTTGTVTVRDNPELSRYEIYSDDQRVGLTEYKLHDGMIALLHTEIDPAFGGRGLGRQLVEGALADARRRGLAVRPFCPYVRKVIADNPEAYLELVPESERAKFEMSTMNDE
jgi:uncharacterized protein